jgi:glycine oxidase
MKGMDTSVVVVGGGIIGASIAWRLSQRGVRVTLLEAGTLGGEASWAGAGMLAPGAEVTEESSWSGLALDSWRAYGDYVEELENESRETIDYRVCGAVEPAYSQSEWRELELRAERQERLGVPSVALTPEEALKRVLALNPANLVGALWYPADAIVNPRDVMKALRVTLEQRGVLVRENVRVAAMAADAQGVRILSGETEIRAEAAVLAAGAWASAIAVSIAGEPWEGPRAYPIRGHLLGFDWAAGALGPLLRWNHTYLVQRAGGLLIVGTSEEDTGFERTVDPAIAAAIQQRAARLLPGLGAERPATIWTGFRPAIEASQPMLGAIAGSRLWAAYGHYRNGILMAPGTARLVADGITSQLRDASAETD